MSRDADGPVVAAGAVGTALGLASGDGVSATLRACDPGAAGATAETCVDPRQPGDRRPAGLDRTGGPGAPATDGAALPAQGPRGSRAEHGRTTVVAAPEVGRALEAVAAIACAAWRCTSPRRPPRAARPARGVVGRRRPAPARGACVKGLEGLSGRGDLALAATVPASPHGTSGMAPGRWQRCADGPAAEGAATAAALRPASEAGTDPPATRAAPVAGRAVRGEAPRAPGPPLREG